MESRCAIMAKKKLSRNDDNGTNNSDGDDDDLRFLALIGSLRIGFIVCFG